MNTKQELPADIDNLIAGLRIENINLKLAAKQAEALLLDAKQFTWDLLSPANLRLRIDEFLAPQRGEQATAAENSGVHPEQAEGAQGGLDKRMRAAGMSTVADMLNGTPLDAFIKHVGVCDLDTFGQWLEMKRAEYLKMQARYDLGERDKGDDLYEWVTAHLGVFTEVHVNFRAAMAQPSPHCSTCNDTALIGDLPLECPDCCSMELQPSPAPECITPEGERCLGDGVGACKECPAPELERPEVVGYCDPNHIQRMRDDQITGFMVHEEKGVYTCEPLMTVAQHAGIIAKWADLLNRANDRADAAQARVAELEAELADAHASAEREEVRANGYSQRLAELEKQEPVAWAVFADNGNVICWSQTQSNASLKMLESEGRKVTPLYAAPVAQAGQVPEGWKLAPFNPTEDQWGGLARAIVFWMRSYPSNKHTPSTLVEFITSLGHEVPEWIGDEVELRAQDHVISKGTVAVLIYKAMLDAAPQPASKVPQAWLDVQAERRRQIEAEGWTPDHDDEHGGGQMARAAACYALSGSCAPNDETAAILVDLAWPWSPEWWKPTTSRRDLVKSAALIFAELERLDRAAAAPAQGGE